MFVLEKKRISIIKIKFLLTVLTFIKYFVLLSSFIYIYKYRYGNRLALINLIRQQEDIPKELILLKEFGKCMTYLNTCSRLTTCSNENNIEYVAYDFNTNAKDPNVDVLQVVDGILQNVSKGKKFKKLVPTFSFVSKNFFFV